MKTKAPAVLVVVPTLGQRPEWLSDCLGSLRGQNYPGLHVRVVCPTSQSVRDLCETMGADYVVCDRKGQSAAINEGWSRHLGCEYFSWLGDDDLMAPESIRTSVGFLERHDTSAMVYGQVRYIDSTGATLFLARPTRLAAPYLRFGSDFLPQPGSIVRARAVRAVGGVSETLRNAMDLDLFIRLGKVGRRSYVPIELAAYRLHDSSITVTKVPAEDESDDVRRSSWPRKLRPLYDFARPLVAQADRVVLAIEKRLPAPAPACTSTGIPYTRPGAWTD